LGGRVLAHATRGMHLMQVMLGSTRHAVNSTKGQVHRPPQRPCTNVLLPLRQRRQTVHGIT